MAGPGVNIGTAFVNIAPSARGIEAKLAKEIGSPAARVGRSAGRSLGSRMAATAGKALKTVGVAGVAGVGAAAGAALIGGFRNAVSRQNSKKVFTGLYGSAKEATAVMSDLRKVASNSPIDYSAYLKAGESLAYAGVKGDDATGTLKNVGKAIVAAGGDSSKMEQAMGGVMKAVNNGGIAMMDSIGQISESGVPILSGLSEKFGKPIDQIKKMASEGKINITDVMDVMQKGTGGTFQTMIKAGDAASMSFGNQWKIIKDNVVNAVGDNIIPLLDKIAPMMKPIGDAVVAGIGKIPAIVEQATVVIKGIVSAFQQWWPVIATVAGGLAAYRLVMLGVTIGTAAYNAVLTVQKFATAGAAVQMRILNAAMKANPIGLIITAVTLLVAGFIIMYKKVGWFRTGVNAAWAGIKVAVAAVGEWFSTVLWPLMQAVWSGIKGGAVALWGAMTSVWNGIMSVVNVVVTWFTTSVVPWFKTAINAIVLAFQAFKLGATIVWNGFKAVLGAVWNWVKTYVFNPIATFAKVTIPAAFNLMKTLVTLYINAWKLVLTTVWAFVKTYVFNPIKTFVMVTIPNAFNFMKRLVALYINAWKLVINVAWTFVRDKIFSPLKHLVTVTIPFAFNLFKNLVNARMKDFRVGVHAAWTWVKDHTFSPLKTFITQTIPNAFDSGVKAIGRFWDKLKSVASKPVKFVVDTVYNKGLVKMWNPIAGFIGKDDWKLDKVDVSKFRSGGKVWGPGTETSDSIPARLSKNEHVLSAKDVRNLGGHGNVYRLRAAAARGWTPGLATGGTLSDAARWLQSKGARITEFGAWGQRVGRHSKNSYHYKGQAFDANYGPGGENATEKAFFDRIIGEFHQKFPKLRTIWRAPGHYNHFHADIGNGGNVGSGGGGGGGGLIPGLDKLVALKDKLKNLGSGRMADAMTSMGTKLIDGMSDKATAIWGAVSGVVDNVKDVVTKGAGRARGKAWAVAQGWPLIGGARWKALDYIVSHESGWNPKAKNPRSTASGLGQFINSTSKAYLGGSPMSRFPFDDQLKAVVKYTDSRYGGLTKAMEFWKRNHYYKDGGAVLPSSLSMMSGLMPKPHVFDGGGWLTDRMVAVHGKKQPDAVLSSQQWADVHKLAVEDGGRAKGGVQLVVNFNGDIESRATAEKVVDELSFEVKRIFNGGKYV